MSKSQDVQASSSEIGKLSRKLIAAFSGQVGVFILGFVSQVIMSRSLGPDGIGAFALVVLIVSTVHTLFHGSLGPANAHFIGRQPKKSESIVGNSFFLALAGGGLLALLFYFYAGNIFSRFYSDVNISYLKMMSIVLPCLLMMDYSNNIVMGQDRIRRFSLLLVLREAAFLLALLILLAIGLLTVRRVLAFWMFAVFAVGLFSTWSALSGVRFRVKLDPAMWLSMLKFSLQAHSANLTTFLKLHADKLIIPLYLSIGELGIYSRATLVLLVLWYLPSATSQVLLPYISHRTNEAGNELTPRVCRIIFTITIIVAACIGIFGKLGILIVFGKEFLPAYPALLILLPGAVIYSLATVIASDLGGRGKPKYAMYISIVALVLNVAVALLLIPRYGIEGAALASSTTHAMTGILFLLAFRHESGVSIRQTVLIQRQDVKLIMSELAKGMRKKNG